MRDFLLSIPIWDRSSISKWEYIVLLARAVFVLDKDNTVKHVEYVPEIASEPNFEAALSVIKSLV